MTDRLIDPDCAGGKHGSCVGGPCECDCHAEEPMTDDPRLTPADGDLRDRIAAALEAADYSYDKRRGDLADDIVPVVAPMLERLRAKLAEARDELEQVSVHKGVNCYWRNRARQAEAERDSIAAVMERMPDTHARFGVVGSDEPPRCADWCDVCRRERVEAERDAAHAAIRQAREELRKLHVFGAVRRGEIEHTDKVHSEILAILDAAAALDASTAPESTDHAHDHASSHAREHGAPKMRPVSVESPGNDGFRYEPEQEETDG